MGAKVLDHITQHDIMVEFLNIRDIEYFFDHHNDIYIGEALFMFDRDGQIFCLDYKNCVVKLDPSIFVGKLDKYLTSLGVKL